MAKFLFVSSSFPSDELDSVNAGVFVLDFARELQRRGHVVEVATPQSGKNIPGLRTHRYKKFRKTTSLSHIKTNSILGLFELFSTVINGTISIAWLLITGKYNFVLCFWVIPSGLITLLGSLLTKTPFGVWALGSDIWKAQSYPGGKLLSKIVLKNALHIFADGHGLAGEIFETYGVKAKFLPSARERVKSICALNSDSANQIVAVGRLHPHKGMDILIKAYSKALENNPLPDLYIYGEGPERDELQEIISELALTEKIFLPGPLSREKYGCTLTQAKLICIPSRVESIPLILGDAVYFNQRIVVTNVGDMGSLVSSSNAGIVSEPNIESLSKALVSGISNNTAVYAKGVAQLANSLSLSNSVSCYLDIAFNGSRK